MPEMESASALPDYEGMIVNKPWGYEYLMYQNGMVGIWYLSIKHGERTSLHCHPRKKTGLVLLSGEAVVSFLNDSATLNSLSKLMIRPGLFHSTAAVSPEGVALIEIEAPIDKTDLVRFEDGYGREEKPYEGSGSMAPLSESFLRFDHPEEGKQFTYTIDECVFSVEKARDISGLRNRSPGETIVILEGGLVSPTGDSVLGPGDVVSTHTLGRLTRRFSAPSPVSLLAIQKENGVSS
jgi:mannose-6-phosphate isomerase-like protein (cupin superfamily)